MGERKVKLLMLLPNLVGAGGQRVVLNLFYALDRERFDVKLLVQERLGSFLPEVAGSTETEFLREQPYTRTALPYLIAETARHAANSDIVIGALEGRASFCGLMAAKAMRKPFVGWLHIDWKPFLKRVSWRQSLGLQGYKLADRIISCSEGAADSFSDLFKIAPRRIQTILNGVPLERVLAGAAQPLPEAYRKIFERPTVVTVGRLDPQKGQKYLLEAHALLLREGIEHNLVMLGDGPLLYELQDQARALGVEDSVFFPGFQPNPHPFIKNATVFALSSVFEGFGLVLVEALACGTPIVSTDCPSGPSEVLGGGEFGVLVKPEDSRALADGLRGLLTDEGKRQQLAAKGPARSRVFDEKIKFREWQQMLIVLAAERIADLAPFIL